MNDYMKAVNEARKANKKSFVYKHTTYVQSKTKTVIVMLVSRFPFRMILGSEPGCLGHGKHDIVFSTRGIAETTFVEVGSA